MIDKDNISNVSISDSTILKTTLNHKGAGEAYDSMWTMLCTAVVNNKTYYLNASTSRTQNDNIEDAIEICKTKLTNQIIYLGGK